MDLIHNIVIGVIFYSSIRIFQDIDDRFSGLPVWMYSNYSKVLININSIAVFGALYLEYKNHNILTAIITLFLYSAIYYLLNYLYLRDKKITNLTNLIYLTSPLLITLIFLYELEYISYSGMARRF